MENKNNFAGIIIPVIIAVILLTVLPIVNSINKECPPCEDLPTLYAPTISINDDTLTITPNSNNGAFVTGYKIYVDDILLDTTISTTYDLSEELTEVGTYKIYVRAYAISFEDSEQSNIVNYVIEPTPTLKVFEVNDILPATTQLKIVIGYPIAYGFIKTDNDNFTLMLWDGQDDMELTINEVTYDWYSKPEYVIIDTSSWSEAKRTISYVSDNFLDNDIASWEDLNA